MSNAKFESEVFNKFGIKVVLVNSLTGKTDYNNPSNNDSVRGWYWGGNDAYLPSSIIMGTDRDSIVIAVLHARDDRKEREFLEGRKEARLNTDLQNDCDSCYIEERYGSVVINDKEYYTE